MVVVVHQVKPEVIYICNEGQLWQSKKAKEGSLKWDPKPWLETDEQWSNLLLAGNEPMTQLSTEQWNNHTIDNFTIGGQLSSINYNIDTKYFTTGLLFNKTMALQTITKL